jgi:hypothetical protein
MTSSGTCSCKDHCLEVFWSSKFVWSWWYVSRFKIWISGLSPFTPTTSQYWTSLLRCVMLSNVANESIMSSKRLFPLLLLRKAVKFSFVSFFKYSILLCWEKLEVKLQWKGCSKLQPLFPLEGKVAFELQSFFPLLLINIIGCFWVVFSLLKNSRSGCSEYLEGQVVTVQHFLEYVLYFHDFFGACFLFFWICLIVYEFWEVCFCFSNYFMNFMSLSCYIF